MVVVVVVGSSSMLYIAVYQRTHATCISVSHGLSVLQPSVVAPSVGISQTTTSIHLTKIPTIKVQSCTHLITVDLSVKRVTVDTVSRLVLIPFSRHVVYSPD